MKELSVGLAANSGAIQSAAAIATVVLALAAIWIAKSQLRETSAQRDITDSIGLTARLDELFVEIIGTQDVQLREHALRRLLSIYEICAAAINYGRMSRISTDLFRNHLRDGLCVVCRRTDLATLVQVMVHSPNVFEEIRMFLVRNPTFMSRAADCEAAYRVFLPDDVLRKRVTAKGARGYLERLKFRLARARRR